MGDIGRHGRFVAVQVFGGIDILVNNAAGLGQAAAKELYPFGITVNAYCPQADSPGHILEFAKTIESLDEEMRPDKEKLKQIEKQHGNP